MNQEFEFGPIAQGVYIALLSLTVLIPFVAPEYFLHYVVFLAFIGIALRPFLVKTGLFNLWDSIGDAIQLKWDKKYLDKRASDIDRQIELEKYRKSRVRDPRLPKNW
jgi:hypothetical protein